jgi:hypothetical protein
MKWIFTLFFLYTLLSNPKAQDITGVWSGTFEEQVFNPRFGNFVTNTYKYEVQLNKLDNNSLEGVTYSYLSTRFYGKASLKGLFQPKTKTIVIKEIKMLEMRNMDGGDGCLMTCYLDYKKEGSIETLTGNFTGVNIRDGSPCESGTVTLKKVPDSKFKKEDFLLKKENKLSPPKPSTNTVTITKPNSNNIVRSLPKNNPNFAEFPPAKNNSTKTPAKPATIPKTNILPKKVETKNIPISPQKSIEQPTVVIPITPKENKAPTTNNSMSEAYPKHIDIEKPKILEERKNKLGNTLVVDATEVTLEFYDNGQIDGDVITVYKNNDLVINKKLLSTEPLILKLHFKENGEQINIYTIAETLGEIAPNTALMVVTYGGKRQEILLTSDTKTNALTIIEYHKATRKY